MPDLITPEHRAAAQNVKRILAVWADIEDLVNIGAYARGTNPEFDLAIEMKPRIDTLLQQGITERATLSESCDALLALNAEIDDLRSRLESQRRPQAQPVAT